MLTRTRAVISDTGCGQASPLLPRLALGGGSLGCVPALATRAHCHPPESLPEPGFPRQAALPPRHQAGVVHPWAPWPPPSRGLPCSVCTSFLSRRVHLAWRCCPRWPELDTPGPLPGRATPVPGPVCPALGVWCTQPFRCFAQALPCPSGFPSLDHDFPPILDSLLLDPSSLRVLLQASGPQGTNQSPTLASRGAELDV